MDYAAVVFLEILYMIAFLALISAGLAVVFGMMRVINLAHGEFVMIGGYATIVCNQRRHRHLVRDAGARAARRRRHRPDRRARRHPPPLRPDDRHDARDLGPEPADGRPRDADLRQHRGQRHRADPVVPGRRATRWAATTCSSSRSAILRDARCSGWCCATRASAWSRAARCRTPRSPRRSATTRSAIYMWTFTAGAALSGLAGGVMAPLTGLLPSSGGALHRQGVHHRHHRRRRDHLRHAGELDRSSAPSTRSSRSARRR